MTEDEFGSLDESYAALLLRCKQCQTPTARLMGIWSNDIDEELARARWEKVRSPGVGLRIRSRWQSGPEFVVECPTCGRQLPDVLTMRSRVVAAIKKSAPGPWHDVNAAGVVYF